MSSSRPPSGLRTRLSSMLGSPLVLAFSVVALVTSVGIISTWLTYRALQRQGEARSVRGLETSAKQVRMLMDFAFGSADPLLDRMRKLIRDVNPETSPTALISRLRGLSTARPALARISVILPNGRYLAVRRDEQRELYAEIIHPEGPSAVRELFSFDAEGELRLVKIEPTEYDARKRQFYEWALSQQRRSWTVPYLFLPTHETGVTRVDPVYARDGDPASLVAVLTVDFDTAGLAGLLSQPVTARERQLVVGADDSILALSGVALPRPSDASRRESIRWQELADPVLLAAHEPFKRLKNLGWTTMRFQDQAYRISRADITQLDGESVRLAIVVPEAELFADARREARLGMFTTSLTGLVGLLLALLLSDSIARLRRKREEAELGEQRAREELAQLGSYELLEPIKKGGMGEVYRARHRLVAREAALKLIRTEANEDAVGLEQERQRFFVEARALASLRSVHTVALYDFGVATDGRYYLAMELLDGFDLQSLVGVFGPQPAARTASILAQICDSLSEAHGKGLVHRDLKPANVFLCRQAEWLDLVKVLDFGLTRPTGYAEQNRVSGTPGYMAPEQARGENVTGLADLYAVGCVGFFLLTGKAPHGDAQRLAMLNSVAGEQPLLPEAVRERVPAALSQLITRCMAKDPEHRPVSATLLASALRSVMRNEPSDFDEAKLHAFWDQAHEHRRRAQAEPNAAATRVTVRRHAGGDKEADALV